MSWYQWADALDDWLLISGWVPLIVAYLTGNRTLIAAVRPIAVLLMAAADLCAWLTANTFWDYFWAAIIGLITWDIWRDRDDDDYWKKKRRRALAAVKRVGARLVIVPLPNPGRA